MGAALSLRGSVSGSGSEGSRDVVEGFHRGFVLAWPGPQWLVLSL